MTYQGNSLEVDTNGILLLCNQIKEIESILRDSNNVPNEIAKLIVSFSKSRCYTLLQYSQVEDVIKFDKTSKVDMNKYFDSSPAISLGAPVYEVDEFCWYARSCKRKNLDGLKNLEGVTHLSYPIAEITIDDDKEKKSFKIYTPAMILEDMKKFIEEQE